MSWRSRFDVIDLDTGTLNCTCKCTCLCVGILNGLNDCDVEPDQEITGLDRAIALALHFAKILFVSMGPF